MQIIREAGRPAVRIASSHPSLYYNNLANAGIGLGLLKKHQVLIRNDARLGGRLSAVRSPLQHTSSRRLSALSLSFDV